MAAARILIDTSVIIDFFRKQKKEEATLHLLLNNYAVSCISAVTYFELLCGAKSKPLLDDTLRLVELFDVIDLCEPEARRAASIYQDLKSRNAMIGLADIFIAATALEHHLPLATLDHSHFERISALQLI